VRGPSDRLNKTVTFALRIHWHVDLSLSVDNNEEEEEYLLDTTTCIL
jgi:hypothetical protein